MRYVILLQNLFLTRTSLNLNASCGERNKLVGDSFMQFFSVFIRWIYKNYWRKRDLQYETGLNRKKIIGELNNYNFCIV
jgi:hypothetical protein